MLTVTIIKQVKARVPKKRVQQSAAYIAKKMKLTGKQSVTIVVVSENTIKKYNKLYRKKDYVTDVLSFTDRDDPLYLGDILICRKQVLRQAKEKGHSVAREFVILSIHGMLHLLGYDHEVDAEAEVMEALERAILLKVYA